LLDSKDFTSSKKPRRGLFVLLQFQSNAHLGDACHLRRTNKGKESGHREFSLGEEDPNMLVRTMPNLDPPPSLFAHHPCLRKVVTMEHPQPNAPLL
jgi:hypothetical protein